MGAVDRLVSDWLYSLMLVHFKCDSRAVAAELRIWELQYASANPVMNHCYTQVAEETGIGRSTLYDRHKAFTEVVKGVRGLVPSLTDEAMVNPAAAGDEECHCGGGGG